MQKLAVTTGRVCVSDDRNVALLDFGMSRAINSSTCELEESRKEKKEARVSSLQTDTARRSSLLSEISTGGSEQQAIMTACCGTTQCTHPHIAVDTAG